MKYLVTWTIDVDAETPEEAARKARPMQTGDTSALVFDVMSHDGPPYKHTLVDLAALAGGA